MRKIADKECPWDDEEGVCSLKIRCIDCTIFANWAFKNLIRNKNVKPKN
jgi:hypothetical protein